MIQGTGSGAGKSLLVAALCRIYRDRGLNVAPFKSQNMALNSYITMEGGEIGRAQALQADAARIEPTTDMNPVLLKASGEMGSQVILQGRVHSTMKAKEYYAFKKEAWKAVVDSYERLSGQYDLLFIEGAGSPAEINLSDVEIVNMAVARLAKAPVLLVGDIDKGGVFASLYGTVKLVGRDARCIRGYIINKFRGDLSILHPGLEMIREKTGRPVVGVLPYIQDIGLPEEDGLGLQNRTGRAALKQVRDDAVRVVVVRHRFISNFTDLDPFLFEPDVELVYSRNTSEIEAADIVVVPGTKNTVKDLLLLRESGIDASIRRAYERGCQVIGICGGYQMLGNRILDPWHVESPHGEVAGIGLLNVETVFERTKTTCRTTAFINKAEGPFGDAVAHGDLGLSGYEIHMGTSTGDISLFRTERHASRTSLALDGSLNGPCWGTYLHGIFDNDRLRRAVLDHARRRRGLPPLRTGVSYSGIIDRAIDDLAHVVRENMDMRFVDRLCGI